jgi:putative membrane protein
MIAVVITHSFTAVWLPVDLAGVLIGTLAAFGIGAFAVRSLVPLKRFFAGADLISQRVTQRAAAAFLSEEVFSTRDRTGILVFVSLLEHRVVVLGDTGINARVRQSDWDSIVATVIQGIRNNTPADGMIAAIGQCGALLQEKGVQIRPDDRDELDDSLRVSER